MICRYPLNTECYECPDDTAAIGVFLTVIISVMAISFVVLYVLSDAHSTHVMLRSVITFGQIAYAVFKSLLPDLEMPVLTVPIWKVRSKLARLAPGFCG